MIFWYCLDKFGWAKLVQAIVYGRAFFNALCGPIPWCVTVPDLTGVTSHNGRCGWPPIPGYLWSWQSPNLLVMDTMSALHLYCFMSEWQSDGCLVVYIGASARSPIKLHFFLNQFWYKYQPGLNFLNACLWNVILSWKFCVSFRVYSYNYRMMSQKDDQPGEGSGVIPGYRGTDPINGGLVTSHGCTLVKLLSDQLCTLLYKSGNIKGQGNEFTNQLHHQMITRRFNPDFTLGCCKALQLGQAMVRSTEYWPDLQPPRWATYFFVHGYFLWILQLSMLHECLVVMCAQNPPKI